MIDAGVAAQSGPHGLLALLRDEHQRIDWMLSQYRQQANIGLDASERQRLIERIDRHLRALILIKTTVFYPLVASKIPKPTMQALQCDHNIIHERLLAMRQEVPDTLAMDIHMEELALHVRDHITIEESRLFPVARTLDDADMGRRGTTQRDQLLSHSNSRTRRHALRHSE